MNKHFFSFWLYFLIFSGSTCVEAQQEANVVDFLSWEKIKLDTNGTKYVNVELDGFIKLEGDSAYPVIRLWESSEAMKHERPFMSISVNSESVSPLLLGKSQSPPLRWKLLNGKYIRIRGVFIDQKKGFDYIDLGNFVEVFDLTITMEEGVKEYYRMSKQPHPPRQDGSEPKSKLPDGK